MLLLRRATRPLRQQLCRAASTTPQPIHDALRQVLENGTKKRRKFDESVDLDVTLNVDPRKPLQAVRGVVSLPHGVGRSVVVAAVADDPAAQESAKAAGADVVGGEDLVDRVADGYLEFDACVATADMAPLLKRKAARVLGPNHQTTLILEAKTVRLHHPFYGEQSAESAMEEVLGRMAAAIGKKHPQTKKYQAVLQGWRDDALYSVLLSHSPPRRR